jgi:hypothetical protein
MRSVSREEEGGLMLEGMVLTNELQSIGDSSVAEQRMVTGKSDLAVIEMEENLRLLAACSRMQGVACLMERRSTAVALK